MHEQGRPGGDAVLASAALAAAPLLNLNYGKAKVRGAEQECLKYNDKKNTHCRLICCKWALNSSRKWTEVTWVPII